MQISKFRIRNYKSFLDSGLIELSGGFNVILGKNNSGKTALLEALNLNFQPKPHRSIITAPTPRTPLNPTSSIDITISISGNELRDIHIHGGYSRLNLPIPTGKEDAKPNEYLELLYSLWEKDKLSFELSFTGHGIPQPLRIPTFGEYKANIRKDGTIICAQLTEVKLEQDFKFVGKAICSQTDEFGTSVGLSLADRIYAFRAERLNVGVAPFGSNPILSPDASNLPEALYVLQSNNPRKFQKLNKLLNEIFPSVHEVSVRPKGNTELQVMVWSIDPDSEREDLAIELTESGTGIGQVLSILYVALTSPFPRTIIIDEPNSFLHPSATRRLIEILHEFRQHQYVISTHSPEIISVANPDSILVVRWKESLSYVDCVDASDIGKLRNALNEIGCKLTDLLGPERLIWVEGPTEVHCFELILKTKLNRASTDILILAVRATGDFENKRLPSTLIWEIYEKLSSTSVVLPTSIAFAFDRDGRSEAQIEDLERRSKGKINFLARRMLENYLISPKAIACILSDLPTFQERAVDAHIVDEWIRNNGGRSDYILTTNNRVSPYTPRWFVEIHGAKLLGDLFSELSNGQEEYRKTTHGVQLTYWLLHNEPNSLEELSEFLCKCIE